jgi:hypothetical protein
MTRYPQRGRSHVSAETPSHPLVGHADVPAETRSAAGSSRPAAGFTRTAAGFG